MDLLSIWTITRNPSDLPGRHVARRHAIEADGLPHATDDHFVGDTLDQVRAQLPTGLFNLGRQPADDPVIVESWI
ncbi:hypothetical protein [Sphingomonas sp. Leaf4]|uniref:hypothetical protein n=1 Tax=Sphingomonas sp. Leaf4 TaxID=2876553 RepID=UPI001E44547A|nr:hypothetical protein [Sphingomonas sp. Leaf4]